MKTLLFILALALLASCSPQKRLARLVKNNPELVSTDTVFKQVPVYMPAVSTDTVFQFSTDTITLEKGRLRVDVIMDPVTKKIYVRGECRADTVYVNVPVEIITVNPVETVKIRKPSFWQKIKYFCLGAIIGGLLLFIFGPSMINWARRKITGE